MFEILFTEPDAVGLQGARLSRYTCARLRELTGVAAKLRRDGWSVWLTVTGLAFDPPVGRFDEAWPDEGEVAQELARLGIHADFYATPSITAAELPVGILIWTTPKAVAAKVERLKGRPPRP